jgi:hypothetical protein
MTDITIEEYYDIPEVPIMSKPKRKSLLYKDYRRIHNFNVMRQNEINNKKILNNPNKKFYCKILDKMRYYLELFCFMKKQNVQV